MAEFDEPRSEVTHFLRDRARAFDLDALPVDADEAAHRDVSHSLTPRPRWTHTPAAVASRARRRPALAAAVMAALLIGSVAGFAVGRESAPKHSSVAARGATHDTTTPTVIQSKSGAISAVDGEAPVMTRLFVRTTADGLTLRGYLQNAGGPYAVPACDSSSQGSWCPPPECNPSSSFTAELSNAEAVSQGGTPVFPFEGPASAAHMPFGDLEGSPASVWMVRANAAVVNVRGEWADGFADEMAPVNGWAIVGHAGPGAPSTIVATLDDGSTFSVPLDNGGGYPTQCQPPPPPPPELPPAGTEQPDDAAAATDAVTKAYQTVFTHGSDPETNAQYMEDAENLQPIAKQLKSNNPEATDSITVDVGEIRFLSKTEAALYFELKYQGGAAFGKQVGYAKLIDGTWKIARDTSCMVFSWGGLQCDPPPDPARSTSTAN